jgi:putative ABC transport system permease protein
MSPLLWRSLLRHLLRHPWQLVLSVLGIALGVAVVLAVDLANASARKSFDLSMERVSGQATHRISGGPQGVPEAVYVQLRVQRGLRQMAPVVTGYGTALDTPGKVLQILGVDLLAEAPLRDYQEQLADGITLDPVALLSESNTALFPPDASTMTQLRLQIGGKTQTLRRVGQLTGATLEGMVITDISTAQGLFDKVGKLSHIDLVLPEGAAGEQQARVIQDWLPENLTLERTAERNEATVEMSASFSLNLTAMSLLALVVGMFLIYNTMTFAVVQRRGLLGILRALGVTRQEIFTVVLMEALLLGIVGTLLGSLLGIWLAIGLVDLVTQAVSDLYYVLSVREFYVAPFSLVKVITLGLVATLVAAWLPAREAADAPPGATLSRAYLEARWQATLPRLVLISLGIFVLGGVIFLALPGLIAAFIGLFLMILACALGTPGCVVILVRINQVLTRRRGLLIRMATRDVVRHLSRTGVAIAALMIAFATTVGVGIMVDSFRNGVIVWINDLVNADIYIASPNLENGDYSTPLKPVVLKTLKNIPEVAAVSQYHYLDVMIADRPAQLLAVNLAPQSKAGYRLLDSTANAWEQFEKEQAIIISEPLAYRQGLKVGEALTLTSDKGPQTFSIAGIFLDYGSEHGRLLMHQNTYSRYWRTQQVGSVGVFAAADVDLDKLRQVLETRLGPLQDLIMRSNRYIQEYTLTVFDRTFTITNVLRLLAIAVAFVGVVSALMALQLERAREFAVLRATGMTSGEIGWLVSLQTGFMGFLAGLLAIPVGLGMAAMLIFGINRRAFGWTLPFQVDPAILIQAIVLAVFAALLAGAYPIWRMSQSNPAEALRSD